MPLPQVEGYAQGGLLSGIASGINAGLDAYTQAQQLQLAKSKNEREWWSVYGDLVQKGAFDQAEQLRQEKLGGKSPQIQSPSQVKQEADQGAQQQMQGPPPPAPSQGQSPQGLLSQPQPGSLAGLGQTQAPQVPSAVSISGFRPRNNQEREVVQGIIDYNDKVGASTGRYHQYVPSNVGIGQIVPVQGPITDLMAQKELQQKDISLKNSGAQIPIEMMNTVQKNAEDRMATAQEFVGKTADLIELAKKGNEQAKNQVLQNFVKLDNPDQAVSVASLTEAAKVHGIQNHLQDMLNAYGGGKLSDRAADAITNAMGSSYHATKGRYDQTLNQYRRSAAANKIDVQIPSNPAYDVTDKKLMGLIKETGSHQYDPVTGNIKKSSSGKIRVTNGSQTYDIDPSDLKHAQADGFRVLQ